MISRRDNLLLRPWQERRYDNHRRKVQSAKPAIDTRPPLPRQHVTLKLKKKQKESERCQEIEKNNFNLLRRLSYVMRTNRVDNNWTSPQPSFLNRVAIYNLAPKFENLYIEESRTPPREINNRKSKCLACTPHPVEEIKIPEERIPWEPQKPSISRFRSKSVPVRKVQPSKIVPKSAPNKKVERKFGENVQAQSIILSRGCLKLSVNFPPDTSVKLQNGPQHKILVQNVCHCKNVTGVMV